MNKLLKTLGIGTALVGCGIAVAGFQCTRCHRWHNGNRCPAITLGVVYDPGYCADEEGWNSDDEKDYMIDQIALTNNLNALKTTIRSKEERQERKVQRIISLIERVKSPAELCRIREAVDNQARNHIGYGCLDAYGCVCVAEGYPYYNDWEYINYQRERRNNHFNCHDQFNCYDPYGCNW